MSSDASQLTSGQSSEFGSAAERVASGTLWLRRLVLAGSAFIFTMIALRYLLHPAASAAGTGITLSSPLAVTIWRVQNGGFPLAFALIFGFCLVSQRRHRAGIYALMILDVTVMLIRAVSSVIDGTTTEFENNIRLFIPEIGLFVLSVVAIGLPRRERRITSGSEIARAKL